MSERGFPPNTPPAPAPCNPALALQTHFGGFPVPTFPADSSAVSSPCAGPRYPLARSHRISGLFRSFQSKPNHPSWGCSGGATAATGPPCAAGYSLGKRARPLRAEQDWGTPIWGFLRDQVNSCCCPALSGGEPRARIACFGTKNAQRSPPRDLASRPAPSGTESASPQLPGDNRREIGCRVDVIF